MAINLRSRCADFTLMVSLGEPRGPMGPLPSRGHEPRSQEGSKKASMGSSGGRAEVQKNRFKHSGLWNAFLESIGPTSCQ
eukprot:242659-Pyramimonas_sp.AAC.1